MHFKNKDISLNQIDNKPIKDVPLAKRRGGGGGGGGGLLVNCVPMREQKKNDENGVLFFELGSAQCCHRLGGYVLQIEHKVAEMSYSDTGYLIYELSRDILWTIHI